MRYDRDAVTHALGGSAIAVLVLFSAAGCGKVRAHPDVDASNAGAHDGGARCSPPMLDCDGTCTSLERDPGNCGACGAACPTDVPCTDGACGSTGCPGGEIGCGGLCVDTQTNPFNCGTCGVACGDNEVCDGGACDCPPTFTVCDGACVNAAQSTSDCGGCGHACANDEACTNGACVPICPPDTLYCSGSCSDPASPSSCGACGVTCKSTESCVGGACVCPRDPQHAVCGGECVDLRGDGTSCGECGKACPTATRCTNGECVPCTAGLFFCPSALGDPLATCRAQASMVADGGATGPSTADFSCQCSHCLTELVDCAQDPQCVSAWQCAATKQCDMPCWGTMGVCALSAGSAGNCWKFCPPATGTPETMTRAEALLRCTQQNGCGDRP